MKRVFLFKATDHEGNIIEIAGNHTLPFATARAAKEYVSAVLQARHLQWCTTIGFEEGYTQVLTTRYVDSPHKRAIHIRVYGVVVRE